jgi:predicted helicase
VDIAGYLDEVRKVRRTGVASEHSYRPALRDLFASIDPGIDVINEPRRVEVGAPDFIFQRDGVARGWAEHKDIDKDVVKPKGYSKEQKDRYRQALPNLIYTNGLDFEFLRDGKQTAFITIADFLGPDLPSRPQEFERLETYLRAFAAETPITIRSAARLAELMAGKAKLIKDVLGKVLKDDPELRSDLAGQFKSFQANLLPNLTPDEFADIYAETVTYGMFAARFHDASPNTFTRQEALELLPKSNPFLRSLFQFVAGYDLDDRIAWIVDDLAEVLRAANVHDLFKEYGKWDARNDPFVHFYEDFLAAYNPAKRKSRGVWYTPEPVVDFIVRAVDDVLKSEFGLADGLADTSKVTIDWDTGETHPKSGKPITIKREVHKVQILDPATGTGTFLAKAVQLISDRVRAKAPDHWSAYVERDLLPRLHGFELLMASYAMCHMKLDMQLTQSGYAPSANPPRLSVWLTNALEPAERDIADLFMPAMVNEAKGAAEVKRQTPIMCVIGNPPYSSSSQNSGGWITDLIEDYKYVRGAHFRERKHWLHDDYVKFLRMAEHYIDKSGLGVCAMITNHGFLDNPTFRGMRFRLLETFDKILIVDLHGNTTKGEFAPDGSTDANVFDIQQGVSIIILIKHHATGVARKRGKDSGLPLASVSFGELWGTRASKSESLHSMTYQGPWSRTLVPTEPYLFFVEKDLTLEAAYAAGFGLLSLFKDVNTGVITARDSLAIDFERDELSRRLEALADPTISDEAIAGRFLNGRFASILSNKNKRGWDINKARQFASTPEAQEMIREIDYRLFDKRQIIYASAVVDWGRESFMHHALSGQNLSVVFCRQGVGKDWENVFVSQGFGDDSFLSNRSRERGYFAPLYLYPNATPAQTDALAPTERTLNLDPELYAAICDAAGIDPADQAGPEDDFRAATGDARPSEVKVFDYIYGVLHSPDYRRTYAEFLKIDFPRVPNPPSPEVFRHVSEKGEALRRLHLMEPAAIGETPYPFTGRGDDVVASGYPKFESGRVLINEDQGFDGVQALAWSFPIGGYQPAQKWLKDRRGRALTYEDLLHYQKILKILVETDRIMREIELPLETGTA